MSIEISKAGLAQALGVARSRITQFAKDGMPTLQNGRCDRDAALEWIVKHKSSLGGGWLLRGRDITQAAKQALARKDVGKKKAVTPSKAARPAVNTETQDPLLMDILEPGAAVRMCLAQIISRSAELPELLVALGIRDMVAISAVTDIFAGLISEFAGEFDGGYGNGDEYPMSYPPKQDYQALAARLGVHFDAVAVEQAVDALCESVNEHFRRKDSPSRDPQIQ